MALTKMLGTASVAAALFCSVSVSGAAENGKMELQSRMWEQSSAEVMIEDAANEGAKEITIRANDLAPNSVYTVWFANEEAGRERESVSAGKNVFRTDENGDAVFSATVPDEKVDKWKKIEVGFHPGGDPANLENVHLAFSGDLSKAG